MATLKDLAENAITSAMNTPSVAPDVEDDDDDYMQYVPESYKTVEGAQNLFDRIQANDPDYVHYWVKFTPSNQATKKMRHWVPLDDPAEIERICKGVVNPKDLPGPNGRLRWNELDLWRRPRRQDEAIRKFVTARFLNRIETLQNQSRAQAEDTTGRSKGKVKASVEVKRGTITTRPVKE